MSGHFRHAAFCLDKNGLLTYTPISGCFTLTCLGIAGALDLHGSYEEVVNHLLDAWVFSGGQAELALDLGGRRIVEWHLPVTITRPAPHSSGDVDLRMIRESMARFNFESNSSPQLCQLIRYFQLVAERLVNGVTDTLDIRTLVHELRTSDHQRQDFLRWSSVFAQAVRLVDQVAHG